MPTDVDAAGRCNHGLPDADSCSYCKKYYDAREGYGNTDDGKCVWVRIDSEGESKCYPKKWAKEQGLNYDEECISNFNQWISNMTLLIVWLL